MSAEPQVKIRLIKRYANRKMYDTERSCYITLEEVSAMVRAGEDVQVIDNKTKEDLTEVTLTQALLDGKRKKRSAVSLVELRKMIASGSDFLQRSITEPVSRVQRDAERTVGKWRSEAEKTVDRVLQRGDEAGGDAEQSDVIEIPPPPAEPTTDDERQIDARVQHLFAHLSARLLADFSARQSAQKSRITTLEAQVAALTGTENLAPATDTPATDTPATQTPTTSAAADADSGGKTDDDCLD